MSTRKISLLAVFTFLLLVCIFQAVKGSINPVKIIKTETITICFFELFFNIFFSQNNQKLFS